MSCLYYNGTKVSGSGSGGGSGTIDTETLSQLLKSVVSDMEITLVASRWVYNDSTGLYVNTVNDATFSYYQKFPVWGIAPIGTDMTEAEETSAMYVCDVDVNDGQVIAYAKDEPTVDLLLVVKTIIK